MYGTVTAFAPIAPGLYRVLIDYQQLLDERRRTNRADPIHAGTTAVARGFSFVIHKAVAGHAVAHVATSDLAAKLQVNQPVMLDPSAETLELFERFREKCGRSS
jgi:hypothetical protein